MIIMEKLIYESHYLGKIPVALWIDRYYDEKGAIYIGLYSSMDSEDEDDLEQFGDLTVNLPGTVPAFCGYLDENGLPEIERFVTENQIGEFTGKVYQSGYCTYPLYKFSEERLKELCPEGFEEYVKTLGGAH